MTVYFLSGLGADERVFQKLKLPQEWKVKHLSWLNTLENENLTSYCSRLSKLIDTREEVALIGLSFGGIVARTFKNCTTKNHNYYIRYFDQV